MDYLDVAGVDLILHKYLKQITEKLDPLLPIGSVRLKEWEDFDE